MGGYTASFGTGAADGDWDVLLLKYDAAERSFGSEPVERAAPPSSAGLTITLLISWQDKAGNATPLTDIDPINGSTVTFVDLHTGQPENLQANLIMPEPCQFISPSLPPCSIIRPTGPEHVSANGAVSAFTADGLFRGQTPAFFQAINALANAADAAQRSL